MRFLYVMEYYPPTVMGGAEISGQTLVEELAKKHEVTVLTPNYNKFKTETKQERGVKVIRFRSVRKFLFQNRKKTTRKIEEKSSSLFYLVIILYSWWSAWSLRRAIKKLDNTFDVIGANNYESILAVSKLRTKAKKVAHLRDFALLCTNRGLQKEDCYGCPHLNKKPRNFNERIIRLMLNRQQILDDFDKIIAISKFVKEQYQKQRLIEDAEVIYNPVSNNMISDLTKQEARKKLKIPKGKVILYVGSLTQKKGVMIIPEIAKRIPESLFITIGDGPCKTMIKGKNILNKGYLPVNKIKDYYRAADVLIVPSLWEEPMGRVVLEAAANGCAVVSSGKGGLKEVTELVGGTVATPVASTFSKAIQTAKKTKAIHANYIYEYLRIIK